MNLVKKMQQKPSSGRQGTKTRFDRTTGDSKMNQMLTRRELGRMRPDAIFDAALLRESKSHFDDLCKRFPQAGWVEFRIKENHNVVVEVETEESMGYGIGH